MADPRFGDKPALRTAATLMMHSTEALIEAKRRLNEEGEDADLVVSGSSGSWREDATLNRAVEKAVASFASPRARLEAYIEQTRAQAATAEPAIAAEPEETDDEYGYELDEDEEHEEATPEPEQDDDPEGWWTDEDTTDEEEDD